MKLFLTSTLETLALCSLPLAAGAAVRVLEVLEADPAAQVETRFLSLWVTAFLFALLALCGARGEGTLWLASLGAVGVVWAVPPAPLRGALLGAVLVATFLAVAVRTFREGRPSPGQAVALALAGQLVARPGLLLGNAGAREVVSLVVLPALAGLALWGLAREWGPKRAMVVGAAVFLLTPGWNVATTFAVVGLVLGHWLVQAPKERRRQGVVLAFWIALALIRFPEGALAALAGVALVGKRRAALLVTILAAGLVFGTVGSIEPTKGMVAVFLGGLALVPGGLLAERGRRPLALSGLVLLAAGALLEMGTALLAPGLGVLALALPRVGPVPILQHRWLLLAGTGTLLLATYPWVRRTPREDTFTWLGMGGVSAVTLPLLVVVLGGLILRLLVPSTAHRRLAGGVMVLWPLLLAVYTAGPTKVLVDNYGAAMLDAETPLLVRKFDGIVASEVVFHTNLVQGAELRRGMPVAVVRLWDAEGEMVDLWRLRAGVHSAEWASARPDVEARMSAVPNPWLSQVAPGGGFFARRYRASWRPSEPAVVTKITVSRPKSLPPEVGLVLYRLEVRP